MPAGQGVFQQGMPGVLRTCSRLWLASHVGTHRGAPSQAEPPGTRGIWRSGEVFGWHVAREARTLLLAIGHEGLLHTTVDLVLRPIRGADKAIEACELQEQTHQTNATRTHLDTDQVEREDQAMQKGEPWHAVKKRHDGGTRVQALLIRTPGLERAAGNLKHLRGVTLRQALRLQSAILLP
jgi:hypothetical protein